MKIADNGKRFLLGFNPRVRPLSKMPYDRFVTWQGNQTFIHAMGVELYVNGEWITPFENPDGSVHF